MFVLKTVGVLTVGPMTGNALFLLPPPLWGRAGEGGNSKRCRLWFTPLPALCATLPRKGGGKQAGHP